MTSKFRTTIVTCLLAGALVPAFGTALAYDGFVAPVAEIPLTCPTVTGARSLGMGGVGLAVADDASALAVNPAALARLRRIEVSAGLLKRSDDLSGDAFGSEFETSISSTEFSSIRFAYPFPTFRGSLVLGVSGERVHDFTDDFLATYVDTYEFREDLLREGGLYEWNFGAAFDASPNVSLGAALAYWTGDYRQDLTARQIDVEDLSEDYDAYQLTESQEADVSGLRFRLGSLFYVAEGLTAALVVETPMTLSFDGVQRTRQVWTGPAAASADTTVYFIDELELPFTFAAGVAYAPTELILLAADLRYTDWSEMTYAGPLYLGDPAERRAAYDATTDLRVGLELLHPSWPVRARAGYMSRPVAYRGLSVDSDRSYFTLGVGVLVDTVISIDFAWMKGTSERSGDGFEYSENVDDTAIVLDVAYRF